LCHVSARNSVTQAKTQLGFFHLPVERCHVGTTDSENRLVAQHVHISLYRCLEYLRLCGPQALLAGGDPRIGGVDSIGDAAIARLGVLTGALSCPAGSSQVRCAPVILPSRFVTAAIIAGQVSVGES
jgi:hypothetical protein